VSDFKTISSVVLKLLQGDKLATDMAKLTYHYCNF